MKRLGFWLVLLIPGFLHAQHALETSAQKKFVSGGTVRLHLEAGGYTIVPGDSENITVTYRAGTEAELDRVRVEINPTAMSAEVYVSKTPHNHFQATIEVPRNSNLWARLSAGELNIEDVEGDKNIEVIAGQIQIDIPHPEQYGRRDASVTTGSIESSAFAVSKGGLFRSFEQHGQGKYRLHAHILSGEIDLPKTSNSGHKSTETKDPV